MSISYSLAPNPKWYIADLVGRPLAGGYLATFSNLDNTQIKLVFEDPAGQFPWPYVNIPNNFGKLGILFDENGSQGPFYWEFDTAEPDELYYIEVYDSSGVLQWTVDDFTGNTGSGGSIITTAINLENLVTNNVFWRNTGGSADPTGLTLINLAPGAHSALSNNPLNTNGFFTGPDIFFLKNNTAASDLLNFPSFTLGSTPLTGDVTPTNYLHYECDNAPVGETFKVIQFPITQGVQNLSNQDVTITIWARVLSGVGTLGIQLFQFFGDGPSASPFVLTAVQTLTLTSAWTKFVINTTIPSVAAKSLGECGNDGLFLQFQYPLGAACSIDVTKPAMYLGDLSPQADYQTNDTIDSVINAPRTGAVSQGINPAAPPGYVIMNDGTIGSVSSGASTRANIDTFPLYNLLWNNVSNTYAPVNGGRGADAVSDFVANKYITLTRILGRALCSAGSGSGLTTRALGEYLGEETHTLTIPEMPAHTHQPSNLGSFVTDQNATPSAGVGGPNHGQSAATTSSTGGGGAHNNMQPSSFLNFYIKL